MLINSYNELIVIIQANGRLDEWNIGNELLRYSFFGNEDHTPEWCDASTAELVAQCGSGEQLCATANWISFVNEVSDWKVAIDPPLWNRMLILYTFCAECTTNKNAVRVRLLSDSYALVRGFRYKLLLAHVLSERGMPLAEQELEKLKMTVLRSIKRESEEFDGAGHPAVRLAVSSIIGLVKVFGLETARIDVPLSAKQALIEELRRRVVIVPWIAKIASTLEANVDDQ